MTDEVQLTNLMGARAVTREDIRLFRQRLQMAGWGAISEGSIQRELGYTLESLDRLDAAMARLELNQLRDRVEADARKAESDAQFEHLQHRLVVMGFDADEETGYLSHPTAPFGVSLARLAEMFAVYGETCFEQIQQMAATASIAEEQGLRTIVVNGRQKDVVEDRLSYEDIVALAYQTPPKVLMTVTYHNPTGRNGGTLTPGQSVEIEDGTVIACVDTSSA